MSTTSFPASVFKAYDIRGTVPDLINPDFARALGMALAARARKAGIQALVVGRDGRLSGPSLAQAMIEGVTAAGVDVLTSARYPPRSSTTPPIRTARALAWPSPAATTRPNTTVSR